MFSRRTMTTEDAAESCPPYATGVERRQRQIVHNAKMGIAALCGPAASNR
jgi:hypothetical protein